VVAASRDGPGLGRSVCRLFDRDRALPSGTYGSMWDSDPAATFGHVATELDRLRHGRCRRSALTGPGTQTYRWRERPLLARSGHSANARILTPFLISRLLIRFRQVPCFVVTHASERCAVEDQARPRRLLRGKTRRDFRQ
jgi:hypothetical protein